MAADLPRTALVGASGYTGGELLRLLLGHPFVNLSLITSETYAGKPVGASFPTARRRSLTFKSTDIEEVIDSAEVVFLAQEHGVAMKYVPKILERGRRVIDLSGDFRLRDGAAFEQWYSTAHTAPELLTEAVYGLPELYREKIAKASLVANPGCYPTASCLALLPLLTDGLIRGEGIVVNALSGVSGAGRGNRSLAYHFPELNENCQAYGPGGSHRHTPEIEQVLADVSGAPIAFSFTPHLVPVTRGLLATVSAELSDRACTEQELRTSFERFYRSAPFVVLLPQGETPTTKGCVGSNECHLSVHVDRRTGRVTVISAIDNLIKGAAGQAVQNMNLMCGFDETAGLELQGLWP